MKRSELKQLIKEEIKQILKENYRDDDDSIKILRGMLNSKDQNERDEAFDIVEAMIDVALGVDESLLDEYIELALETGYGTKYANYDSNEEDRTRPAPYRKTIRRSSFR